MASRKYFPIMVVGAVGVVSGMYIFNQPLQELSGKGAPSTPPTEGRSQNVKDGSHNDGSPSSSPQTALRYGGAAVQTGGPTVAGTSAAGRQSGSVDHNVKTRSNASVHDGTSGGGVGVAEMRERKMEGQGLPSKQGGDTPAKPVAAVLNDGEGGGIPKKQGRWWLGGW